MGLCASSEVQDLAQKRSEAYKSNETNNANTPAITVTVPTTNATTTNNNNNNGTPGSGHTRRSTATETKLQTVFKSKRVRKKVVMEASAKDQGAAFTEKDLTALQAKINKKTTEQSDWLATVLASQFFMYNEMEKETQEALVNVMECLQTFDSSTIITQGDIGDYMYIVEAGKFDVFVDDALVGHFSQDVVFGELALLYDAPRAATIKTASDDTMLWRIGREVFKYLIKAAVQASSSSIMDTLNSVALLEPLTNDQKLQMSSALEPISFNQDDIIIKQGDEGDIFYIIKSGSVVCTDVNAEDAEATNLQLNAGDYFGELALMTSKARQRNVVATSPTVCLALDRISFQKHLGTLDNVLSTNSKVRTLECTPLFETLSSVEKNRLAVCLKTETFVKDDAVVTEDQNGDTFYIIVEGNKK